jgi:hypothetical protein
MHLCCPDLRCLCCLQCRDHSSLAMAIPPPAAAPFCCHCQPLSSHSCRCQPLLAFTAPIDGWLLRPSLLCHPLPAPLSVAPIIDTFFAGCRAVLFLICAVLFLIAPLPPSTVVIHPATALNLAPHRAPLVLWCSCLSSILAGCCVASHHAIASCLPVPLPAVLPLPLVIRHDWLLHCRLHLSSRHRLPSAWASTSFYLLPPPPATNFFCPLLLRLIDALSFCQLWQWAKASIPNKHDGNCDGNDGGNGNSNSDGGGNGFRDFSSTSTPISLSLFDCCMFYSGFGFAVLLSLPHHLPPLPSPHLPTPLLPTAPPPRPSSTTIIG